MTIAEAKKTFITTYRSVFEDEELNPSERTRQLQERLTQLLESRDLKPNHRFQTKDRPTSAIGFVCVSTTSHMNSHQKFKTYRSRNVSLNPTVVEAISASCAWPGAFQPVSIGPPEYAEQFTSCRYASNNPTYEAVLEASRHYGEERQVSWVISLGCGKPSPSVHLNTPENTSYLRAIYSLTTHCEQTATTLERQWGRSGVYYRFCVDQAPSMEFDSRIEPGTITSYTKAYIEQDEVDRKFDQCLRAFELPGKLSLRTLCRSNGKMVGTANGLPALSIYYVSRPGAMERLVESLLLGAGDAQRIAVVSGIGGSGKTQLVAKFARDHADQFQHILFVDASSVQTIQTSLVTRVRGLGRKCKTVQEAIDELASWDQQYDGRWLLIFDNADSRSLQITKYFPRCDDGHIIVTTRNMTMGELAPDAHLELGAMSESEGIQLLLNVANAPRSDQDVASKIAEELGYLPVALVQAGSYIKQRRCLNDYLNRLANSRQKILQHPLPEQRDRYQQNLYAALDLTQAELSSRAQEFISLLSFGHHRGFPRPLIELASQHHFTIDMFEYVDRDKSYHPAVELLHRIICPSGEWNDDNFDDLLVELQQASLINFCTEEKEMLTLSIHPLVRAWAQDRLQSEDAIVFRNAMARVLACGAAPPGADLHERMISHINAMKPHWDQLHINELTSFAVLLAFPGIADDSVMIWERALKEVKEIHGDSSEITLEVARKLKEMYVIQGDEKRAAMIQQEIMFASSASSASSTSSTSCTYVSTDSASFVVTTPTTPTIAPIATIAPTLTVKRTFIPSLSDELSIQPGELVRVLVDYDDGWALCEKTATSERGVIPQVCLDRPMKDSTVSDSSQTVHIVQSESRPTGTRSSSIIHGDKSYPPSVRNETFVPSRSESSPVEPEAGPGTRMTGPFQSIGRDDQYPNKQTTRHPNIGSNGADPETRIRVHKEISTHGGGEPVKAPPVTMNTTWWSQTLQSMTREVESRIASYGVDDTLTIDSLLLLSTHIELGRRFEAAEGLKRFIGSEMSPGVVMALEGLAANYQSQGCYWDAIPLLEGVVGILRAAEGRQIVMLNSLEQLAHCYEQLKMIKEAEAKWAEILLLRRQMGSQENPNKVYDAVEKLASCYEAQGKYLQAIDLLRELLETRSKLFGPTEECSVAFAERLAFALEAVARFEMAQPLREALLCIYEQNESELPSTIFTTIAALATIYELQGSPEQAITLLERYASSLILLRQLPLNDQISLKTLLARFYEKAGRFKQAEPLLSELLDSGDLDLKSGILVRERLAAIYETQGAQDEARNLRTVVQYMRKRYFGLEDFATLPIVGQPSAPRNHVGHENSAISFRPARSNQTDRNAGVDGVKATLDTRSASRTMDVGRVWSQHVIATLNPSQSSQHTRAPTILSQFRNVVRGTKKQGKP
ncbi:hypothetical protein FRC15_008363 [Serendipita sp. 397]|nr:hypothetical protein FRC15_008363 [Serendipita sp. 397]